MANWFEDNEGVRQDDGIFPMLFVHYIYKCIRRLIFRDVVTMLDYADDTALAGKDSGGTKGRSE